MASSIYTLDPQDKKPDQVTYYHMISLSSFTCVADVNVSQISRINQNFMFNQLEIYIIYVGIEMWQVINDLTLRE